VRNTKKSRGLLHGGDRLDASTAFWFIDREKAKYRMSNLCLCLEVSKSGYYAWARRKPSARSVRDAEITQLILGLYHQSTGTYGAPRLQKHLAKDRGIRCSKKRVARLMKQAGIAGISRRSPYRTTRRNPKATPSDDLVKRNFTADAPNKLWVADITEHPTGEGRLFLATVMDAFSRRIVGWSMGDAATSELTINAVTMAIRNRAPDPKPIHHSDHGCQYTSVAFSKKLRKHGIVSSMGTVGDALDNALAESFNATLQTELLDRHRWLTRDSLATQVFWFIEAFYNRWRLHSSLGYLCPAEYEDNWYREKACDPGVAA